MTDAAWRFLRDTPAEDLAVYASLLISAAATVSAVLTLARHLRRARRISRARAATRARGGAAASLRRSVRPILRRRYVRATLRPRRRGAVQTTPSYAA